MDAGSTTEQTTGQTQTAGLSPAVTAETAGVLKAETIGKSYSGRQILRDISITVNRGEVVGLLGPNGAGKTTCFYTLTGLVEPDHGKVTLNDQDITHLPMYRRAQLGIGYLPQEMSIFRGMTVSENIMAVLEVVESDRKTRQAMLDELLEEFSITHLRDTQALALSGGERRRCEIARALAARPSFVLLDEPFAGIDPIAIADIRDLTAHLKHRGIGVLITDHNVRETLDIIDRAYIIYDGHVLFEGNSDEVLESPDVRRVYLGENFTL